MTRKFDTALGQYRDSGKFDGNDNQPAAGGMNALGGDALGSKDTLLTHPDRPADRREQRGDQWIQMWDADDGGHVVLHEFSGDISWHDTNGLIHRDGDLPATVRGDGQQMYLIKGLLHRNTIDGPAVINTDGSVAYYEFGIERDAPVQEVYPSDLVPASTSPEQLQGDFDYLVPRCSDPDGYYRDISRRIESLEYGDLTPEQKVEETDDLSRELELLSSPQKWNEARPGEPYPPNQGHDSECQDC